MDWIEADPLPEVCQNCQEEECYNCDYAGARWYLSPEDEEWIKMPTGEKGRETLPKASTSKLGAFQGVSQRR